MLSAFTMLREGIDPYTKQSQKVLSVILEQMEYSGVKLNLTPRLTKIGISLREWIFRYTDQNQIGYFFDDKGLDYTVLFGVGKPRLNYWQ